MERSKSISSVCPSLHEACLILDMHNCSFRYESKGHRMSVVLSLVKLIINCFDQTQIWFWLSLVLDSLVLPSDVKQELYTVCLK